MHIKKIIIVTLSLFIFNCGKSPLEKAESAFNDNRFPEAINYYSEVLKEDPGNNTIKEKIALAYFKQGEMLFKSRPVLSAYQARIDMGIKYIPDQPSEEMKKILSNVYYNLAHAYKNSPAENPYQKEKLFEKTIELLQKSILYNGENVSAKKELSDLEDEHFQQIYKRGLDYFNKGKNDLINFIYADHYLTIANTLKPGLPDVTRQLNSARTKALNVLDPGQRVPIAVTDRSVKENYLAFYVVIQNLDIPDLSFETKNFVLFCEDGTQIKGEEQAMFASFLRPAKLNIGEETEGVIAFPIKAGKKYFRLELQVNGTLLSYKNLPI
jgi:tetratricopeptide (TPR) repeat protein